MPRYYKKVEHSLWNDYTEVLRRVGAPSTPLAREGVIRAAIDYLYAEEAHGENIAEIVHSYNPGRSTKEAKGISMAVADKDEERFTYLFSKCTFVRNRNHFAAILVEIGVEKLK